MNWNDVSADENTERRKVPMASDVALSFLDGSRARRGSGISDRQPFLSTLPAGPRQRQLALWVVLVSGLIFAAVAPFAKLALPAAPAFLPIYQSALVVIEVITAVLLFGQFGIVRSPALLGLAGAYLFSALMAVAHMLSFPGLFAPSGLLGAGGQTTAWLYFLWHGGFPLLIIGYALLADRTIGPVSEDHGAASAILSTIGLVFIVVCGLVLFTTAGHDQLPSIMQGNRDAPAKVYVATASWMLTLVALPVLWRRRPHSVLDLWLMVVLWVWVFDIALSSVLNQGRYDLGWYAGRVYGLFAASFVLIVLLLEYTRLHAEVLKARETERRSSQASLAHQAERLRIVHEIDRAILSEVKPEAIAAAVLQPLRRLLGVARVNINLIDEAAGDVEWFASAGRQRTHIGSGLRFPAHLIGDLHALKRGEPQKIDTRAQPPGKERDALLATGVYHYMAIPMVAADELIGAVSFGGEEDSFPGEQVVIAHEVATQLAVAIGNARLYEKVHKLNAELEQRVRERTAELQIVNRELESFSYSVSHDLRAPLRAVDGYALMLQEDYGPRFDEEGRRLLDVVRESAAQMGRLIDDLLKFSQVGRKALVPAPVDMHSLASEVISELSQTYPKARIDLSKLPVAAGDRALLRHVWVNLIGNGLKYSLRNESPRVEISGHVEGAETIYQVRDNGAGFDMRYREKLFQVFQRLHRDDEFEGTGVGLAIVQRVIARHGGRVWGEGAPSLGACFRFALPKEG
jgi:signal transduction histidine kinase